MINGLFNFSSFNHFEWSKLVSISSFLWFLIFSFVTSSDDVHCFNLLIVKCFAHLMFFDWIEELKRGELKMLTILIAIIIIVVVVASFCFIHWMENVFMSAKNYHRFKRVNLIFSSEAFQCVLIERFNLANWSIVIFWMYSESKCIQNRSREKQMKWRKRRRRWCLRRKLLRPRQTLEDKRERKREGKNTNEDKTIFIKT